MESVHQSLGGARQSSPLENEMSYPLTKDEFLLIKENLSFDKFSNWESFLLSTGISFLISCIILLATGTFEQKQNIDGKEQNIINISQVVICGIYGALTIGPLLGFFIFRVTKKTSVNSITRLEEKITKHLNGN